MDKKIEFFVREVIGLSVKPAFSKEKIDFQKYEWAQEVYSSE